MKSKKLRNALLTNALFSAFCGLTLMSATRSIGRLMGVHIPIVYRIVGGALLAFAGFVAWTGTRQRIKPFAAALISIADVVWVAGTLVVIAFGFQALEPAGIVILLAIAGAVLAFAIWQLRGIGGLYAVPGKPRTHALCVTVDTPTSPDALWRVIADLPNIDRYSPNLTDVFMRDGAEPAVGAVRQCTDTHGNTWGEHCTRYDEPARRVEFEFLAEEPGFPYPFKTMVGGWDVQPNGNASRVTIWFEVTPKYRMLHPIILVMMARGLAGGLGDVVGRMAAAATGVEKAAAEIVDRPTIRPRISE